MRRCVPTSRTITPFRRLAGSVGGRLLPWAWASTPIPARRRKTNCRQPASRLWCSCRRNSSKTRRKEESERFFFFPFGITMTERLRIRLVYHFCRVQMPAVVLPFPTFEHHLQGAFGLFQVKQARTEATGQPGRAFSTISTLWTGTFAVPAWKGKAGPGSICSPPGSAGTIACSSMPCAAEPCVCSRDPEQQEQAVEDFWGYLLAGEKPGSRPSWPVTTASVRSCRGCIRVFQEAHLRTASDPRFPDWRSPKRSSTVTTSRYPPRRVTAGGMRSFAWRPGSG